jgi:hypothetical protein
MSIYKRFEEDDIVRANPTEVTTGLWTGDTGSLTAFFTSSTQASSSTSGQYFWNVYNVNANTTSSAEVQFAVAYGHRLGGGQASLSANSNSTLSTLATYLQYRNLLLEPDDSQFTFDGNWSTDHIYVLNIQRARLKENLDPGNWQVTLSGSSGKFTFIDDSGQTLGASFGKSGEVFKVVSGTLTGGVNGAAVIHSSTSIASGGYGLCYPTLGIVVLNPDAIKSTIGMSTGSYPTALPFAPRTGSTTNEWNHAGLYNAIVLGGNFTARSAETISSTHYFVHLRNKEFNYSNNPSFYDETSGGITNSEFIRDPRVYPTTIGFYNDNNELLAVAKLSKATQKSFDKEMHVRVKLDW